MIPDWALRLDWNLIREKSSFYNLEPEFVATVIQKESSGNTFACRYEPNFKYTFAIHELADLIGSSYDTMEKMQKTSYGLMQVMGAVAYEHSLQKEETLNHRWATALVLPEVGVEYGCRHLKRKMAIYGDDPATLYSAYNAGSIRKTPGGFFSNQSMVDKFMTLYRELKNG